MSLFTLFGGGRPTPRPSTELIYSGNIQRTLFTDIIISALAGLVYAAEHHVKNLPAVRQCNTATQHGPCTCRWVSNRRSDRQVAREGDSVGRWSVERREQVADADRRPVWPRLPGDNPHRRPTAIDHGCRCLAGPRRPAYIIVIGRLTAVAACVSLSNSSGSSRTHCGCSRALRCYYRWPKLLIAGRVAGVCKPWILHASRYTTLAETVSANKVRAVRTRFDCF